MSNIKKDIVRNRRISGQGMTEYIIIVVAVAVLSLAVVMKYGNQIRNLFIGAGNDIADNSGTIDNKMAGAKDDYDGLSDISEDNGN
ncbi:MAG: hypothetical protein JXR97_03590 [Planctomycetes bacterium]|nr:hypothetical protein [Planctomycetota bacterium]